MKFERFQCGRVVGEPEAPCPKMNEIKEEDREREGGGFSCESNRSPAPPATRGRYAGPFARSGRRYFSIGSLGMSRKKSLSRQPSTDPFLPVAASISAVPRGAAGVSVALSSRALCIDVGGTRGSINHR